MGGHELGDCCVAIVRRYGKGWAFVKLGEENDGGKLKSYPKPMFDFNERRQICIDGMKHAYDVGLYGDSPKVKDGSWKKIFGVKGKKQGHEDKVAKKENTNGDASVRQDDSEMKFVERSKCSNKGEIHHFILGGREGPSSRPAGFTTETTRARRAQIRNMCGLDGRVKENENIHSVSCSREVSGAGADT